MHAIISGHMHYTCRYSAVSEIAVKSKDQIKDSAATAKFNHACFSPPFLFSSSTARSPSSINLQCWSSLVNTDLEQLPLYRRRPHIAYMMSMKGKVKVTSSTVMKTYAAQVQSRFFYNSVIAGKDGVRRPPPWNHKAIRFLPWKEEDEEALPNCPRLCTILFVPSVGGDLCFFCLFDFRVNLSTNNTGFQKSALRCCKASGSSPKSLHGELQTPAARRLSHTLIPHHSCLVAAFSPAVSADSYI